MALEEFDNAWVAELLFTVDAHTGVIIDAAGEVESSLGLPPADLVGFHLLSAIHRDDVASAQEAFDRTVAEGRATWEGRVLRTDGNFTEYGWEGRLGQDGRTIYARSRDVAAARGIAADLHVYERLADLTPDIFVVSNATGRIVKANASVAELHGGKPEDYVGTFLSDFVTDEGKRIIAGFQERLMSGESLINFQIPGIRGDGSLATVEGTATFDEATERWYVVERDVTERVEREQELEITQRFFDLSASQLVLVDSNDRVVRANRSFLDLTDSQLSDVEGLDIISALRVVGGADIRSRLAQARKGEATEVQEVRVRVGGSQRTFEIELSAPAAGGTVYLSCRDVTEERSLRAELLLRASRDSLTGLANRPALLEAIDEDLAGDDFVAVLMLDLDGFKGINDTLGHAAGDELLVRIAERLEQRTRGCDVVARMGGDEFTILLRGIPDTATIGLVGEKIRRAFHESFDVDGRPVDIIASIGAAGGHRSSHSAEQLLLEADLAAYSAKHAVSDECRVFDGELRDAADFASAVEMHLRRVLSASDFDLDVVELKGRDGERIGLGVTAPALSISGERGWNSSSLRIAKNLGLLRSISARLTEEAVRRLAPWLKEHPESYLEMVYNVSEVEICGFESMIMDLLATHGVDPAQFVVGLSDHGETDARAIDPESIDALRAVGVRVALSDSFADAQTLSVISNVGLDRIDVDAAHVAATADGSVDRAIANTVLDIADRLGIVVMVDANFTPDLVDIETVFGGCVPVGVRSETSMPIEDFLRIEAVPAPQDDRAGEAIDMS